MNSIYFLLFFEIILLMWAFLLNNQDIMAPSVMMCVMFVISTIFTIINIDAWNVNYSIEATLMLSSGIFVFLVAETFFRLIFVKKSLSNILVSTNQISEIKTQSWMIVFLIVFNLIISFWYYSEIKNIVGNNEISITGMFAAYRRLSVSNLANSKYEPISILLNQMLKIVKASGYIAAYIFLNKSFFKDKKIKWQMIGLLLIIIISLIPSVMIASRSEFLKLFSAVLIEYYILWHQKYGWHRNLSWKYMRIGLTVLIIGMPLFYNSLHFLGRGTTEMTMMQYVSEYIGSSIYLFDLYIKEPILCSSFGEETLVGMRKVLGILGIQSASKSSNLEFRMLGLGKSNVYTFFRRPLHDFGLLGMYLFTALVACLFAWIYYCKIKGKSGSKKTNCWVLVYGYLYYWIVCSSIDQYSQSYISVGALLIILAIVLGYLIMSWSRLKLRVIRKH